MRRIMSGWGVYIEVSLISSKRSMHKTVILSVIEAELIAAVPCSQDILYARIILTSLEFKVRFPMLLNIEKKVIVDLINNWGV